MEVTIALVGRNLQEFNALKLWGTSSPLPQSAGRIGSRRSRTGSKESVQGTATELRTVKHDS